MSNPSSKKLAQSWPFARYTEYQKILRQAAKACFQESCMETHSKMGYCLASNDDWKNNIICKDVADYISQIRAENAGKIPFSFHKYIHHGLSSQAMTFNLMGPLWVRRDLEPLRVVVENAGVQWPGDKSELVFEYCDRDVFREDTGQPTSIDVKISGQEGNLFIETKLREQNFGGCSIFASGDCEGQNPYPKRLSDCFLHHLGRPYWDILIKHGISNSELFNGSICPFANYYQFFREVLFAFEKEGSFVLMYDNRSPVFVKTKPDGSAGGLWPFLRESIPMNLQNRVAAISIQDVVDAIQKSGRHEDWIHAFKKKYAMN